MPIRPELARKLHEALGPEAAGQMVDWMHDVDRTASRDVALRGDVAELRHATSAEMATLRHEVQTGFAEVRQEMQTGFAEVRQEMQTGLAEVRQEMRDGDVGVREAIAQLEIRLERRIGDLIKWSFVFWVGAVSAIAMLAGVLA